MTKRTFAIAAHPDDIEFQMAGTLILLHKQGYEIHYMNVANGSCGSASISKEDLIRMRRKEAMNAAQSIGAIFHESLVDDIAIFYNPELLARLSTIMRIVSPEILLIQSPHDYMEDHQNTARLAATAAFTMGMPNFQTSPEYQPVDLPIAVYHAQPHGNRDIFRNKVSPDLIVDITSVIDQKATMLACHKTQKSWLDESQGMHSYIDAMRESSSEVGHLAANVAYGEGWRRRSHLGFSRQEFCPLEKALDGFIMQL